MTLESLRKLEKTPVGETVNVEGKFIRVEGSDSCDGCYFSRGGVASCDRYNSPVCSFLRPDKTSVIYLDVTPPAVAPHNELLNSVSTARRLGVTVRRLREMARGGVIPAHKNGAALGYGRGRDWIFDSRDVDAYMNGTKIAAPELELTAPTPDAATRLLPFDGVDEHMVYPIARYRIEELDHDGLFGAVGYVAMGNSVVFSGDYGARDQAIEACRADLRIRLAAVDELRGAA